MIIKAKGNQIESIEYTYNIYFNAGHANFLTGTTKVLTPVSPCEVSNDSFTCECTVSKVYGIFGELYRESMQCTPDWQVGAKLDVEYIYYNIFM